MFEVWCSHCNQPHDHETEDVQPKAKVHKMITPGAGVWIPDPRPDVHSWQLGSVLSRCGSLVTVQTNDPMLNTNLRVIDLQKSVGKSTPTDKRKPDALSKTKFSRGNKKPKISVEGPSCLPANEGVVGDMTELHFTHEPAILHNLKVRAHMREPYTFIGNVLVSINPLQNIPEPPDVVVDDIPHPRTVAEKAYVRMLFASNQRNRLFDANGLGNNNDHSGSDSEYEDYDDEEEEELTPAEKKAKEEAKELELERKERLREELEERVRKEFGLIDQSVLISGESGSGKTEAAKRVLCHLVDREGYGDIQMDDDASEECDLQDRLIGANPILESFGNAKTHRNPNSSRFGKFLKLRYEPDDDFPDELCLFGASITTYLLERSRVTFQEAGEKNYRIFYQMLTCPNPKLHKLLGLTQASHKFKYLGGNPFTKLDEDRVGYVEFRTAFQMANLGIKASQLFSVIAAVLHLGNIEFVAEKTSEGEVAGLEETGPTIRPRAASKQRQAVTRRSIQRRSANRLSVSRSRNRRTSRLSFLQMPRKNTTASTTRRRFYSSNVGGGSFATLKTMPDGHEYMPLYHTSEGNTTCGDNGYSALSFASYLLGVRYGDLREMLLRTKVKVGSEMITKRVDVKTASRRRDAIAKLIYSSLFDWIVRKLNMTMHRNVKEGNQGLTSYIGVLDVFGFEEFEKNGFEQLLINYANEVLLSLFTREILIGESEMYKREGLLFKEGELQGVGESNEKYDSCLTLFEGSVVKKKRTEGIFAAIDNQGRVPSPSDSKLLQQFYKLFSKKDSFVSPHPSKRRECFMIKHYASTVTYTIGTFLEKNDQSLPGDIEKLLSDSVHKIINTFPSLNNLKPTETKNKRSRLAGKGKSKKKATVAGNFAQQMSNLKEALQNTSSSYIRCVKPNPSLFFNIHQYTEEAQVLVGGPKPQGKNHANLIKHTRTRKQIANNKMLLAKGSKSNMFKQTKYFDEEYVGAQLKNLGIYDCVNVLRGGLPTRIPYPTFMRSYDRIIPFDTIPFFKHRDDEFRSKMYVSALMYAFGVDRSAYKLGATKIFFQNGQLDTIKHVLKTAESTTSTTRAKKRHVVTKAFKRYYVKKRWKMALAKVIALNLFLARLRQYRAASKIKRLIKAYLFKRNITQKIRERLSSTMIQKHWRAFKATKVAAKLRKKKLQDDAKEAVITFAAQTNSVAWGSKTEKTSISQNSKITQATPEKGDDDQLEFKSTFSSVAHENNAMRGTLQTYFNRRVSFNRNRRTRASSFNDGLDEPYEEFSRSSKLSNATSLFHYKTVKDVSNDEWKEVEYVLLDFDGPNLDPEFVDPDFDEFDDDFELGSVLDEDEFESEEAVLKKSTRKSARRAKSNTKVVLKEVPESEMDAMLKSSSPQAHLRRKSTLREPKSLQERIKNRKNDYETLNLSLVKTKSNLTVLSPDNFADFMMESLAEQKEEGPTVSELNLVTLNAHEDAESQDGASSPSQSTKAPVMTNFGKKKSSFTWIKGKMRGGGEVKRNPTWLKDKKKNKLSSHKQVASSLSLPSSRDRGYFGKGPLKPAHSQSETLDIRKDSQKELQEEASDKSSNFVKRMAAMWGTPKRSLSKHDL